MIKRQRSTKVIATLGPASSSRAMIKKLYRAGADVFRINMSHTNHAHLQELVSIIRDVEKEMSHAIAILADLQGPKLRIGTFADGAVELAAGETFAFVCDECAGNVTQVFLPHAEIFDAVEAGHQLLLDDGKIRVVVTHVTSGRIETRVDVGGVLSDRKGIALPQTVLPIGAMTPKDRDDLQAVLDAQVDWIALSFVQRPDDLHDARAIVRGRAGLLAKIEKPQALACIEEIVDASDAVMVARGDLGVEMPLERVPGIQKQITRLARRKGCPVVIATQMLESMISSPVPTRAEVSDVATAVFEGADAVMLSAEAAVGKYPVEAITTMNRVAIEVERDVNYRGIIHGQRPESEPTGADAITAAARNVAETLNLAAIVCYTSSGSTGLRAARERPLTPIIALSPRIATVRRLTLSWGIHSVATDDARDVDDMVSRACRIALREGYARPGERILITAGFPLGTPGATNLLRIAFVGDVQS